MARALGLGRVWLKLESERLGLPAFKILGASWAVYRALAERFGDAARPGRRSTRWPRWLAPQRR